MINTLEKGDLIGVAYNNYIWPAVYVGGPAGNAHFYRLMPHYIEILQRGQIPHVDYIARSSMSGDSHGRTPIVKVSADCLSTEQQEIYIRLRDLLIKNRKI